ncbi:MAG: nucleotidyltransferase domain-containing protein, partial [Bacteroidetes bacterium CG02_land_8_20_14_3_00_31_25]
QTSLPKHLRASEVRKHLYGMMIPIDLLVYTPIEYDIEKNQKYSFLNSIITNSKVLYERKD